MQITKREIIASITIIALMLTLGFIISGKITDRQEDANEKYNKALKIVDSELFTYGMSTNVGNVFVYGYLKAVDPVNYPDVKGEYLYIEKVKERYTEHTRIETYYTGTGKTRTAHTRTVVYWTWDRIGHESKKSKRITFCGVEFKSGKIVIPGSTYLKTARGGYHIRYRYYGSLSKYQGTIFANLRDNTIEDHTPFYQDKTIQDTIKMLESNTGTIVFWVTWIVFTIGIVYGFYYLDNRWLE